MPLLLPELQSEDILETITSLRKFSKVVTAFSRQFIPYNKLRKENTLKVSHKGLTTQSIPYSFNDQLIFFEMELDFHLQSFWVKVGEDERQIPFTDISEMEFYSKIKDLLNDLGFSLKTEFASFTCEEPNKLDIEVLEKFLQVLHFSAYCFKLFRSDLEEHTSSLQFRPSEMDLVMNVFTGEAVKENGQKSYQRRLQLGFCFGNDAVADLHYYITADPFPAYVLNRALPEGAYWKNGEEKAAVLPYNILTEKPDPRDFLLEYFDTVKNELDNIT